MEVHVIGIDLGKTVFHLVGLNQGGDVVVRKHFGSHCWLAKSWPAIDAWQKDARPGNRIRDSHNRRPAATAAD